MDETLEFPALVADRYELQEIIGRGGMALVGRVVDRTSGRQLALKRLRPRVEQHGGARELFEREYRTLAQLAHPRIVEVVDYGLDGEVPFYTMELLDGGDLVARAPLGWRAACEVAHDVCSALSLVHARAMVYRDLSPRNVRCTGDGKAKLLDFGAMAPTGSAKFAVCTPAVASPEVVNMQALDARTDLYALGATLYQTLTGRPPYPAKSFRQLEALWKQAPPAPSSLASDVPEALDTLVMDLLQLDANVRPASAAEVGQRLAAIAGLPSQATHVVAQSYLIAPTLVGRDAEFARVQRRLQRLREGGRGGAMAIVGPAGSGHTRLLDACVLQAKLDGVTVLRVTRDDAGEAHGAASALANQLCVECPDVALEAADADWAVLARILPQLAERAAERELAEIDPDALQARTLPALRDWLIAIADRNPLALAIDDVELLEPTSRSLIALLAERCKRPRLLLWVCRDSDRALECAALDLLDASSRGIALVPLSLGESHELFGSIFGDVPNLQTLVHHLHEISGGNPRRMMHLAQHLLDQGIIRHHDSGFALPERLVDVGAPASMAEVRSAAVSGLGATALVLARAIAATDPQRFDFHECELLGGDQAALRELLDAVVLVPIGAAYRLADVDWKQPLLAELGDEDAVGVHARLGEVFARRGDGLRGARHLMAAAQPLRAVEVLAEQSERSTAETNVDPEKFMRFLDALPEDWFEICVATLRHAEQHERRNYMVYTIQNRFIGVVSQTPMNTAGHGVGLATTLANECGLDLYEAMDPSMDAGTRLQEAIGQAMQRHGARAEAEQLFDPITALRHFARTLIALIGNISQSLDMEEWEQFPPIGPFAPLSLALSVVHKLEQGFDARRRGQYPQSSAIYRGILEMLSSPEELGLDKTYVTGMQTGISTILGILEATMGTPEWEKATEQLAAHPGHDATALLIRSLAAQWQGDVEEANKLERGRERLRLENPRPQYYEAMGVLWRFQAHAVSEDLTRAGQELGRIERTAQTSASWQPVLSWARGEYERLRGDNEAALGHLEDALEHFEAGRHQLWPQAAATRLLTLCALGRHEQAQREGEAQLELALSHDLHFLSGGIRMGIALAAARSGDGATAWKHVDAALQDLDANGVTGLNLGLVHESGASVAIFLRDAERFEQHAPRCAEIYLAHRNRALATKYERLLRAAKRSTLVADDRDVQAEVALAQAPAVTQLTSILETCSDPAECMLRSLELMAEQGGARGAYLITMQGGSPTLRAQSGADALPPEVLDAAGECLRAELDEEEDTQDGEAAEAAGMSMQSEDGGYRQLLLGHYADGEFAVNGLLLLRAPERELPSSRQLAEQLSRFLHDASPTP